MCTPITKLSLPASVFISVVLGVSMLLPAETARAQGECGNLLSAGPVISPISGSKVIIGQTITVTRFTVSSAAGNCDFQNGEAYYAQPDGTITKVLQGFSLSPNQTKDCTGTVGNNDAACLSFTTSYIVNAADIGRTLTIVQAPRGQFGGSTDILPGTAGEIHFYGAGNVDGFDTNSNPTGAGSGQGFQRLTVVRPGLTITKECDTNCFPYGAPITFHGTICNTGDVRLINISVTDTPPATITFAATTSLGNPFNPATGLTNGECINYSGTYQPAGTGAALCGPFTDTIVVTGTAQGVFQNPTVSATNSATCFVCNNPGVSVTKDCPIPPAVSGGSLNFSGVVSNTGNVPLTNVMIVNDQPVPNTTVTNIALLPVGAAVNFSGSYTAPLNQCDVTDTVTVRASGICGGSVTNSATRTCPIVTSPAITVIKNCPANLIQPGAVLNFTGSVVNNGNVTLTNVVVVNDKPSPNFVLLGPITLAPGAGTNFSGSYVVPVDSCGPYVDTLVATGADKCTGIQVASTNTATCPGTNSPAIRVTKKCPDVPPIPGGITTFSGTVSNIGNITLTNVIVLNDQPSNNTPVIGPITLPPGAGVSFSGSYEIPLNSCTCVDTLKATGADKCFGRIVASTATAVCPTLTTPQITVTKECPPGPTPLGQPLVFSGIVSNSGNITLTNVIVVNNQPAINTHVFGPATLAPGEIAFYSGSYIVPINICDSTISDTVTASGKNICNGNTATASSSAQCEIIPTPRLSLTKNCPPAPVPPGGLLTFSGTVSNTGTVTITNIFVVNDQPTNNTPVIGPITLAPGTGTNFTGSYRTCPECCPPYVDTLTATGNEYCKGSNVIATATASCAGISSPSITVTKDFCDEAQQGQLLFFSGTISNAGDVALGDVTVTDDHAGVVAQNLTLAPGESVGYLASYVVTNCGANVLSKVTVIATDICTGLAVSNNVTSGCVVTCSNSQPIIILNPRLSGSNVLFSFATQSGTGYTVQYTPALSVPNWQVLTNVVGNGAIVDISDSMTETQRFYRVSSP